MSLYKKIEGASELLNEVHKIKPDKSYELADYFNALIECDYDNVVRRIIEDKKRGSDYVFSGARWDLKAARLRNIL